MLVVVVIIVVANNLVVNARQDQLLAAVSDLELHPEVTDNDSLQAVQLHVVLLVLTSRSKSANLLEIVIASKNAIEHGRYSGSKRPNTCRTVEIHSFTPSY